jgi:hypothetical protein
MDVKVLFNIGPVAVFTTLHNLRHGPNKIECYNTLGFKDLPGTNALAYRTHSEVT